MIYVAKADTWFKAGTEAELLEEIYTDGDGQKHGDFKGTYIVGSCRDNDEDLSEDDCMINFTPSGYDVFWYNQGFKDGQEVLMTELCCYDEFYHCKDKQAADLAKLEVWLQSKEGRDTIIKAQLHADDVDKFIEEANQIDHDILNIYFNI